MNEYMFTHWMDYPIFGDQYLVLPCGHIVHREHLRIAGGICPTCEQDKDLPELKDWPPEDNNP